MALDLSALVGDHGGASSSSSNLNEDFSVVLPSGDSVFTKAFGDQTVFLTPSGHVKVTFLFDPKQPFSRTSYMASITTDYMSEIRDCLCKQLLEPKDIAPSEPSLEEKKWRSILRNLPNETLSKHVFADKNRLEEFIHIVSRNVEDEHNEEAKLLEAITTRKFKFAFPIAIDAYAHKQNQGSNKDKSAGDIAPVGVLTFHIEGVPDAPYEPADVVMSASASATAANDSVKKSEGDQKPEAKPTSVLGKRKENKRETSSDQKDKEDMEKVKQDLGLDYSVAKTLSKRFPETASTFFENVNAWFSSVINTRSQKLQQAKDRNPLYQ